MNDLDDPALKQVLAQARRGWSPSADDVQRVRRGVDAALAHGLPGAAVTPHASAASTWVSRVLLTAAFTAAGAGAGYWAGRRAPRTEAPAAQAATPPDLIARPLLPVAPDPTSQLAPPAAAPAPPSRRIEPLRRRAAEASGAAAGTPAESLAVEIRELRNVERALRDGNPGLAGAFLDDLDRAVPDGKLREERAALRSIVRCMTGTQPIGVDLAEEFSEAYAASAYRARVQQACNRTDSPRTGDSPTGR